MNEEKLLKILLSPHISEKTSRIAGDIRQYAFRVLKEAKKPEIKVAVEQYFNVKVKSVRVSTVKSKQKRFGGIQGSRKSWKKAYVSLHKGQEIKTEQYQ